MPLITNNGMQRWRPSKWISISKERMTVNPFVNPNWWFREKGEIKICNDGRGIPVRKWAQDETIYIPTLIFGKLLTSDNFNDDQRRITGKILHLPFGWIHPLVKGGRNGYGAKVTNIFSTKFTVETCSKEYKKSFKQVGEAFGRSIRSVRVMQTWTNNMRSPEDAIVTKCSENPKEFTRITFIPDLKRFQMDKFDDDLVALFKRRAYDVAVSTGCKVTLNGKRIPVRLRRRSILATIFPLRLGEKHERLHVDVHRELGKGDRLQESERTLGGGHRQERSHDRIHSSEFRQFDLDLRGRQTRWLHHRTNLSETRRTHQEEVQSSRWHTQANASEISSVRLRQRSDRESRIRVSSEETTRHGTEKLRLDMSVERRREFRQRRHQEDRHCRISDQLARTSTGCQTAEAEWHENIEVERHSEIGRCQRCRNEEFHALHIDRHWRRLSQSSGRGRSRCDRWESSRDMLRCRDENCSFQVAIVMVSIRWKVKCWTFEKRRRRKWRKTAKSLNWWKFSDWTTERNTWTKAIWPNFATANWWSWPIKIKMAVTSKD